MKNLAVLVVAAIAAPIIGMIFVTQAVWSAAHLTRLSPVPSDEALEDIPAHLLNAYLDAGLACGTVPWNVTAAVAKVENDHGRDGEFTFPPVPDYREEILDDPDRERTGVEYHADDGIVTPTEQAAISAALSRFLCSHVPDVDIPTGTTVGDVNVPDGPYLDVANAGEWAAAVAAAQPGDVIRLTGNINQPLTYQGPSGTADNPIWVTAEPEVWIDPGAISRGSVGFRTSKVAHVNIVGIRVRNTHFGIWVQGSNGAPGNPMLVAGNTVTDVGQAGIIISDSSDKTVVSSHVRAIGNTITRTGRLDPHFGEGMYIGSGTPGWQDHTHHIEALGNDISHTTGDGMDIKPGTRDLLIEGNLIHDHSPQDGGGISAHWAGSSNPNIDMNSNLVVRGNAIWNQDVEDRAVASNDAIWLGHGGVTLEGNVVWGTRVGVRLQARAPFGSHPVRIVDNIFWTRTGINQYGDHTSSNLTISGNKGPAGIPGVDETLERGPGIPGVEEPSTADTGTGPGSAFGYHATHSGFTSQGYEGAEAARLIRVALLEYSDDEEWVDEVWEIADGYASLPEPGQPGQPGGPMAPGIDAAGCPTGPAPKSSTVQVHGYWVHTCIAANFQALMDKAAADGIDLTRGWAWRDHFRQHELRRINGCPNGWVHGNPEPPTSPSRTCRVPTAPPGNSMHERGLAIDFRCFGGSLNSRQSRCFQWLSANAPRYGLINFPAEPWHWSINGR